MAIADHPVQAQMAGTMAMTIRAYRRETRPMDMGVEEGLKVMVIITAQMEEETSDTIAVLVEEEEAKLHIKMEVVPATTAITEVKLRVMVSEVEVTITITMAMAGDEHSMSSIPVVRPRM